MAVTLRISGLGRLAAARGALALGLAAALGACGQARPFVYDPAAYDRDHVNFAKTPETVDVVTVCYSKYGATQEEVARLAADVCGRYGAGIRFDENDYATCPLVTPVGARFLCLGAPGSVTWDRTPLVGAGTPGQPGAPTAGFREGARPMGILFGRTAAPAPQPAPLPAPPVQPDVAK